MSPYASRCNWCGRSTSASAFFQVLTLAGMVLAILVLAGVMPMSTVTAVLPDGWLGKSPLPMQTADVGGAGSGGSSGSRARGGYGSVEERNREVERTRREAEAREKEQRRAARLAAAAPKCDSEARIDALAARHETWTREDLALIACRKVATGFSTDQLIAARGRPLRRIRPDGAPEVWVYRDMRVVVEGDRAVSIRMQ